jgi:hypothetical protein
VTGAGSAGERGHRQPTRRIGEWTRRYRAYRRLYPLWQALFRAHPEMPLLMPPGPLTDALTVRHLNQRLRQRAIEIHDGLLVLRDHMDAQVADVARRLARTAGLQGIEAQAVVEAAQVAAALHKTRFRLTLPRPGDAADPAELPNAPELEAFEQVNTDLELTWLEAVSTAYASSPLVRQALVDADVTESG